MNSGSGAGEILERYRPLVDGEIRRVLEARGDAALYDMLRYHLGWADASGHPDSSPGGKRVRSALCLLTCEAAGGRATSAAPAGAGIELLHAFTLLHDDIADEDEFRRGRPAVWRIWGIGPALTAGDAMHGLANLAMARLGELGLPPAAVISAWRELNEAAVAVCEGQQLDLSFEGQADVRVEDYLEMIERKTGALFAAAAGIGAVAAGAPREAAHSLRGFGRELGVAYQMRDDVLGIWGEPEQLGKPVGSDLRRNKRSLPILHALTEAKQAVRKRVAARLAEGVGTDAEAVALAGEIEATGARKRCEDLGREAVGRALDRLASLRLAAEADAELRALASYFIQRTR